MNLSPPPTPLTPTLISQGGDSNPDVFAGNLDATLMPAFGASVAKKYSALLMAQGFDSPEALRYLNETRMQEMGILVGHRSRVVRALFSGVDIFQPPTPPLVPPHGSGGVAGAPPEALNVTVQRPRLKFDVPVPGSSV